MNVLDRDLINSKQVTLDVTGSNWSTVRSVGVAYQTTDGTWRLSFNIEGSFSAGTGNVISVSVAGVTFSSAYTNGQSIAINDWEITNRGSDQFWNGLVSPGSSNIQGRASQGISYANAWLFTGDVELDSKPSFID